MLQTRDGSAVAGRRNPLKGKRIFIPPMAYGSGRAFAAAFRALGLEADITPPSDHRTRELGARYTSGDECYPAKVTIGDFMRVLEQPGVDPAGVALFMPTADGPCRFGQYMPYLRSILAKNGYPHTEVIAPSSNDGYGDFGDMARQFVRTGWRALIAADLLQKTLLQYRPYEVCKGDAEAVYEDSLGDVCKAIETSSPLDTGVQLKAIRDALVRSRDRFRKMAVRRDRSTPLIGIVGEIFCRLHCFSNEDLVRHLEEYEAEAWISDITEWIWYTIAEQFRKLHLKGQQYSLEAVKAWVRKKVQKHDEHVLLEPFHDDFKGYEEPPVEEVLEAARPYLPNDGAMGEMVLNVGKAICLAKKGADGIIDISPFTCMNGIVCEAVYPRVSRDLGGIPIRNFYFDGTQSDLDRDLGVYLELARGYQRRKKWARTYPESWG